MSKLQQAVAKTCGMETNRNTQRDEKLVYLQNRTRPNTKRIIILTGIQHLFTPCLQRLHTGLSGGQSPTNSTTRNALFAKCSFNSIMFHYSNLNNTNLGLYWAPCSMYWVAPGKVHVLYHQFKGAMSSQLEETFNRAWNWCPSLKWPVQWLKITGSFMQQQR